MDEVDASIVRECGIPMSDVEDMSLYQKMLVIGYKPRQSAKRRPKLTHANPPELRMPRFRPKQEPA